MTTGDSVTKLDRISEGIAISAVPNGGMLLGRAGGEDVVLARAGDELFAVGAHCTHYHGPLVDGLIVGDTVRCPWHHACFSLRSGEAVRAPALDPIACWRVERRGDTAFVREKLPEAQPSPAVSARAPQAPSSVIIVGGGGAGLAAADMLRREGYDGRSDDQRGRFTAVRSLNLSKDYQLTVRRTLDSVAPAGVLQRAADRAAAWVARVVDRRQCTTNPSRRWFAADVRRAPDCDRRRSSAPGNSRRRSAAGALPAFLRGQPCAGGEGARSETCRGRWREALPRTRPAA